MFSEGGSEGDSEPSFTGGGGRLCMTWQGILHLGTEQILTPEGVCSSECAFWLPRISSLVT